MQPLIFRCPSCENRERRIEQVVDNACFSHQLSFDEDHYVHFHDLEMHDAEIIRHQCFTCGFVIRDEKGEIIQNEDELVEWLERQPYNLEEN